MNWDPKKLRKARKDLGLSQTEAAKLAGIAQTQWSRYERGVDNPRPIRRRQLTLAVGLDYNTLERLKWEMWEGIPE